jgi:hypothetical protein
MGVIVVFFYDLRLNLIGTIYATIGVLVTALYQVVRESLKNTEYSILLYVVCCQIYKYIY